MPDEAPNRVLRYIITPDLRPNAEKYPPYIRMALNESDSREQLAVWVRHCICLSRTSVIRLFRWV